MELDDTHLWDAFDAAVETGDDTRPHAAAIVEFHLGFIRSYANQTVWSSLDIDEYIHELVCVALKFVPRYDRRHPRQAKFVTFLRPYLQEVRWVMAGRAGDIPTGKETRRMVAAAEQVIAEYMTKGDGPPTLEEIDEFVSKRLGKRIGVARVERALGMPRVERADALVRGGDGEPGVDLWGLLLDNAPTPEDVALSSIHRAELDRTVTDALAAAELTELDKALVVERLTASPRRCYEGQELSPGPTPYRVLAARYGMSVADVRFAEAALVDRLRDLLRDRW